MSGALPRSKAHKFGNRMDFKTPWLNVMDSPTLALPSSPTNPTMAVVMDYYREVIVLTRLLVTLTKHIFGDLRRIHVGLETDALAPFVKSIDDFLGQTNAVKLTEQFAELGKRTADLLSAAPRGVEWCSPLHPRSFDALVEGIKHAHGCYLASMWEGHQACVEKLEQWQALYNDAYWENPAGPWPEPLKYAMGCSLLAHANKEQVELCAEAEYASRSKRVKVVEERE